jgi:hypothetical protein
MDHHLEKDSQHIEESPATKRFAALTEELGATYPQLTPAAAAMIGQEEAFDTEILAGLVNVA